MLSRRASRAARELARGAEHPGFGTEALADTLKKLAEEATQLFGVECRFVSSGATARQDAESGKHFYRIVQEAIHNAVRHGRAQRIEIQLEEQPAFVCVRVWDNGFGFGGKRNPTAGMGVSGMRRRALAMGAELAISSHPGQGTEIRCLKPLSNCGRGEAG